MDPNKLVAYNISIDRVIEAVRAGNNDVGGRLVEFSGLEYMVRGIGYIKKVSDVENIVVGTSQNGRYSDTGEGSRNGWRWALTSGGGLLTSMEKGKSWVASSSCVLERTR